MKILNHKKKKRLCIAGAAALILAASTVFLTTQRVSASFACKAKEVSENFDTKARVAIFEGKQVSIPELALKEESEAVLGKGSEERWIEVDLSDQKLKAWHGDGIFLETSVSTGLPWWPTPQGEFRIWTKFRSTKMEGGSGRYYYNLPNVPYVMFFENEKVPGRRGYGLHGTYWHNDFGTQRSHGCVNLPTPVAQRLFSWTTSKSEDEVGTKIIIHQ